MPRARGAVGTKKEPTVGGFWHATNAGGNNVTTYQPESKHWRGFAFSGNFLQWFCSKHESGGKPHE